MITPDVDALRRRLGLPGMCVLQFAFGQGDGGANRYLPHNHEALSVCLPAATTTTPPPDGGRSSRESVRDQLREYFSVDGLDVAGTLVRAAFASVADTAVVPMQDVLRLGGDDRMNLPGTATGNWSWRFDWAQVGPWPADALRRMVALYGRSGD